MWDTANTFSRPISKKLVIIPKNCEKVIKIGRIHMNRVIIYMLLSNFFILIFTVNIYAQTTNITTHQELLDKKGMYFELYRTGFQE